ncbi:carbon-monoxide dehydrogenase large subunit [Mesorhizobium soli]|uniref:xanthine dehydrogenase family protein molybdopterin-binding subunit n=1 Tax=Pseudaminobacter soli (ex Li et al. 2025) TaxID=1295366 RepID=UPI002473344B|nr:xanthine dehydrogenase family protein molybdopterin-binding subunit [Mesorhizobium soli]MDH6229788.1 carbon-monoxide dehydrogenase large subunit [Mesorhizobium soli]
MDVTGAIGDTANGWMGRSVLRREDRRLVTGRGAYVDDHLPEGCLHLEFVRSQVGHGKILSIDCDSAREAEGVVAVFTAADLDGLGDSAVNFLLADIAPTPLRMLAGDVVSAAGQPIAAVVATSLAAARDAAELVYVDIEPLPLLVGDERKQVLSHGLQSGEIEDAFAAAAHVVSVEVEHSLLAPMALEPRAALASFEGDFLTAWFSTQTPNRARDDLARILGLPLAQIRVVAPDVGGAFGGKASIYPEDVMVAWASKELGRPVKWCSTRGDELLAASHGRGGTTYGEMALSADGKVLGLRARLSFRQGHWMPFSAVVPARNAGRILPGPYRVGAVDIGIKGFLSHGAAVGIYRGAGRPEATMLMERLMDEAARKLAIDPMEIRRLNLIPADAFPYKTPNGEVLDSGNYGLLIEKAIACSDYAELRARQARRREAGEVVGIGVGLYIEPCGQGWESAGISLCRDGSFVATTGSSAQGQGRETAFSQIVADALSISPDRVAIKHGDTAEVPSGIGALASRSTAIGGGAMVRACDALCEQIVQAAAEPLECDAGSLVFSDDGVTAGYGAGGLVSWRDLAEQLIGTDGDPKDQALSSSVVFHADGEAWASGCCLAVVAIDRDTGVLAIEQLLWVDDAGRILNPLLVRGQLVGGMAQGLGEALMERIVYDEDGQLLTGSLMDYAVPRAIDMPSVRIEKIETPSPTNPLGVKGVGEAGCIGIPAAVVNAVNDALAPFRAGNLQMPLTSEKIWLALQGSAGTDNQVDD